MPVPVAPLVLKKLVKSFSLTSSGMPQPLSVTLYSTPQPSGLVVSRSTSFGVSELSSPSTASILFVTRLRRQWWMASGSSRIVLRSEERSIFRLIPSSSARGFISSATSLAGSLGSENIKFRSVNLA